jgi:DNA repair protein RadC
MRVLHRLGLLTAGSILGFRAFSRFTDGVFEPEPTPAALRRFQAVCWQADALACGEREGADIPYRASVLASVFGGGLQALGIQAVCTALPACERCPLAEDCRWCHGTAAQATGASEIQALARNGAAKHLGTDQLLQGLFDLEDDARAALHSRLATTPLRRLAAQAPPELQGWLDGSAVPPEKLLLVFELCRRFNEERLEVGVAFQTPWDLFKHFRMRLRDLKQEQFIAVLLDNKKRYLSDHVITQGTLDASPVHPREVFLAAIRESAAALVIVHNHPSGDPKPSRDDIEVTLQLRQVGQLVGIPVVDHVIIAGDTYASLLDLGLLEK